MIIINKALSKRIYDVIDANKRVKSMPMTVVQFEEYCDTINRLNSLDRRATLYEGFDLSKWAVPAYLKGFVAPSSVTLSGKSIEKDLRKIVVSDLSVESKNTLDDFYRNSHLLLGIFKNSEESLIDFSTRTDESVQSIGVRVSYNGKVLLREDPFVPVPLSVSFYDEKIQSYSDEEVLIDYLKLTMKEYLNKNS